MDTSLENLIKSYVLSQFPDSAIDNVRTEFGYGADGEELVNVTVVFGEPPQSIKIGNLTRVLWERLVMQDQPMLPIFSFLTREEDARLSEAA